ncbi:MAG: hypothetical protein JWO86_5789 [Myxococcaceae bacterium]|jgi:uncharacterized membrane protein|nr:hypothetical protein [Myxococcaceae bacterium]
MSRDVVPSAADLRADRIRARRRIAMRVGLLVIAMASALTSATACIFDRSTYQGGGRVDHGASAATQSATDTTPTSTTTTPPADGGLDSGLDTGLGSD